MLITFSKYYISFSAKRFRGPKKLAFRGPELKNEVVKRTFLNICMFYHDSATDDTKKISSFDLIVFCKKSLQ